MQELFSTILSLYSEEGVPTVESLLFKTGKFNDARRKLEVAGFDLSELNNHGVACLFFALNDILVVKDKDSFYLCTMSRNKLFELFSLNRVVPKSNEDSDLSQTKKLISSNTLSVINNFLEQGKFHVLKLNMVDYCKSYYFLTSVSHMNPYPTFKDKDVYALSSISNWYNILSNELIKGYHQLKLVSGGSIICHNYLSKSGTVPTSCSILVHDTDNTVVRLPIWDIISCEPYSNNDFVLSLMNGVVKYDDKDITLNREILEKYYGKQLYTSLESVGVRRRYCLEELLSVGVKYSVAYYVNKYNLGIFDCEDIYSLENKLIDLVKDEKSNNDIVHARILYSSDALKKGYKSFYQSINLNDINEHKFEQIENIEDIMPKLYTYYGISEEMGYASVTVKASSINLAKKYGETEFNRQFGKHAYFCTLECAGVVISGVAKFEMSISQQYNLCQSVMYGYLQNYKGIYNSLDKICKTNGLEINDDYVKFLFINRMARKYKDCGSVKLHEVSKVLIDFLVLVSDKERSDLELAKEFEKIAVSNAKREFRELVTRKTLLTYDIDDTNNGRYIQTDYGRFKITDNGVSSVVDIYYRGKKLCQKRFSL